MNSSSFDRIGRLWSDALQQPPVDSQQSLVRLLESIEQPASRRSALMGPVSRGPGSGGKVLPIRRLLAAALVVTGGVAAFLGYERFVDSTRMAPAVNVVPGAWLETRRDQKMPMRFSEGSEVVVSEASRVRVASVDPRGASVVVERGSLRANIVHRNDTNWAFAAGPFNVRVTGTTLRVGWSPEKKELSLTVEEGSVVAEGPLLGKGRAVAQGETCKVQLELSRVECSGSAGVPSAAPSGSAFSDSELKDAAAEDISQLPLVDAEASESSVRATVHRGRGFGQVRELEKAGKYAEGLKAAEHLGIDQLLHGANAEDLFCLARLGRYQGRADLSHTALVQIRERFAKSKEAASAAFLLGRQSPPGEAARWFSVYLAEQPQGSLAREASGRLVESLHRSGQFEKSQAAARRYLAAYPTGPHAGFAKSLLANP